jgi:hypothetical protein
MVRQPASSSVASPMAASADLEKQAILGLLSMAARLVVRVWAIWQDASDEVNSVGHVAALTAVKVFLNDAVGIIGKL